MSTLAAKRFSAKRMHAARTQAGLTHLTLARAAGTSEKNIGNWERGVHAPRGESVVAIAHATGHDVEFFYTEGDDEEDEEAALRRAARELLAPLNDSMVDALMSEIQARGRSRS